MLVYAPKFDVAICVRSVVSADSDKQGIAYRRARLRLIAHYLKSAISTRSKKKSTTVKAKGRETYCTGPRVCLLYNRERICPVPLSPNNLSAKKLCLAN